MGAPKGHPPYPGSELGGAPKIYTKEVIESYADKFEKWLEDKNHVWYKDFCLENNLNPDLMSEWSKENKRFAGVLNKAKQTQESRLVNNGLKNKYNSQIVKFVLTNKHRWEKENQSSNNQEHAQALSSLLTQLGLAQAAASGKGQQGSESSQSDQSISRTNTGPEKGESRSDLS